MFPVETLPQSLADTKIIVLKPRLDQGDARLVGDKIKPRLFNRFGFKSKPEHIRLLGSESYYEPYLIIGGKYSLDYCKKHVFRVNVEETTTKVYVAGQEFKSVQSDPKTTNRTIKMTGEEHAHHEREAYFILDRLKREISPDKLPISPFDIQKDNIGFGSNFKSINISDETQIDFLRTKIATRPADLAEIIRENFDITDRTIAYYPMYQLTFENSKNQQDEIVTINGITGEIILNGIKRLAVKTIVSFPQSNDTKPMTINTCQKVKAQPFMNLNEPDEEENTRIAQDEKEINQPIQSMQTVDEADPSQPMLSSLPVKTDSITDSQEEDEQVKSTMSSAAVTMTLGFPARISGEIFTVGDNVTAVVGDLEIPPNTRIDKTLVVKGALRIGDNCRIHGRLKALKDVTVGNDTTLDGDLISGGNVSIGSNVLITGSLQAAGQIKIGELATIERGLCSSGTSDNSTDIQLEANFENAAESVAEES